MRSAIGFFASFTVSSGVLAANVLADPADDALAKLNELSRQAEQTTEALHSAQLDLNEKLAAQRAADQKLADNRTALDAARARLATFQTAVNKVAAATYMGGRTHGMDAILTAESPQLLIDRLSVQRVMAHQMSTQMARFKAAGEQAVKAEQAAAKSAADARSAAEQAAAVRANLQHKQSQLQVQIAVVIEVRLPPEERTALADPGPVPAVAAIAPGAPPAALPPGAPPGADRRLAWPAAWWDARIAFRAARRRWRRPYGRCPSGVDAGRRALRVGWCRARRVRLLRLGDVGVPAGWYRVTALQPGAGSRWSAGRVVGSAARRRVDLLFRRVTRRHLHR
ncbi:NLP/P60 family protein [Mycobacterium tuberculosis CAS/NITR204]|uniref:NLP/P60 family protein n=1 Tax=Mycobacterium tuberculosis CAS/NITR204 TaxID=1310114 RepID=R4MI79_MYCTX|nr:NLP/P60 family protein [Mycobacterium tuberculosis CAS/NITR204]